MTASILGYRILWQRIYLCTALLTCLLRTGKINNHCGATFTFLTDKLLWGAPQQQRQKKPNEKKYKKKPIPFCRTDVRPHITLLFFVFSLSPSSNLFRYHLVARDYHFIISNYYEMLFYCNAELKKNIKKMFQFLFFLDRVSNIFKQA